MTFQNSLVRFSLIAAIAAGLLLAAGAFFAQPALAQDTSAACDGVMLTGGSCSGGRTELGNIIRAVTNILSIIVGALAVIMIIVGGLRYITSGGDSGGVQSAKNTILYAIVGLLVVVFAQVIVNFAITESTTPAAGGGGGGGGAGAPTPS